MEERTNGTEDGELTFGNIQLPRAKFDWTTITIIFGCLLLLVFAIGYWQGDHHGWQKRDDYYIYKWIPENCVIRTQEPYLIQKDVKHNYYLKVSKV